MSTLAYINTPPPTPHQLAIAHLASRLYPRSKVRPADVDAWFNKNAKYHHAMLRLISREALFGQEPSSYADLLQKVKDIAALSKPMALPYLQLLNHAPLKTLTSMPETWSDLQKAFELMEHIPDVYFEREDEGPQTSNRIAYTSPLGIFLRKVYLGYKTLSFQQTDMIREQVLDWCSPERLEVPSASGTGPRTAEHQSVHPGQSGSSGNAADVSKQPSQRSSGSLTVSMDLSVSIDVSRTQEEFMDLTQDSSGVVSAGGNPEMPAAPGSSSVRQSASGTRQSVNEPSISAPPEHPHIKRRKIVNRSTELDDTLDTRVKMFKDYQSACIRGDYSLALHSLDRFYNYRFPGHDKKLHQHALLNLASFHYNTGGLETARHILHEAIKVARIEGDKQCLLHCVSLSRRIEAETTVPVSSVLVDELPPHVADVGADDEIIPPLDELWNIKRRLDLGEALPAAYCRIWKAIARQESIVKTNQSHSQPTPQQQPQKKDPAISGPKVPHTLLADPATVHSVQASLWHMFGSALLGDLHEELALRRSPSEQMRLGTSIARAQRLVTKSKYNDALATILEAVVRGNLNISEYHRWAHELWSLVELIIARCGSHELGDTIQHFQLPPVAYRQLGAGAPLRMITDTSQPKLFDAFGRDERAPDRRSADKLGVHISTAEDAVTSQTPIAALPPLLGALHIAEHLGLWNVHQQCTVKLSLLLTKIDRNVQPNFIDPFRNRQSGQDSLLMVATSDVEPMWDKIISSGDDEMIFAGAYVLGCGIIKENPEAAMRFGKVAMGHALMLGNAEKIGSAAKLLAIASHKKDNLADRDAFSAFWVRISRAERPEDWLQPDIVNPVIAKLGNEAFSKNAASAANASRWKHEYQTLKWTLRLLPELVARVGVNVATAGLS